MDAQPTAAAATALDLAGGGAAGATRQPRGCGRVLLGRALRLALRRPGDAAASAGFYVLVAGLLSLATAPMGLGTLPISSVAAWSGALLAALLAQQQGLRADATAGVLDQVRLAPGGMVAPVAALVAGQVAVTAVPLLIATPAVVLFFRLDAAQAAALMLSLLVGLPAVSVIAVFAATLTLGSRASAALAGLLMLPLSTPVLLFGVRAADPQANGGALLLLLACSLLAAVLGPLAVAAALSLEEHA